MIIMAKKSLKDVRTDNTAQVLECILKQGQSSRIEIAEKTMLSPSTVGQAVALLMEKGLVEELRAGESTGGRRPILLRVTPGFGCIATVEIKRSSIAAQVFDMAGQLLETQTLMNRWVSGNDLLDVIDKFLKKLKNQKTLAQGRLIGLGLLYQDDIPEYDLMVEYSTLISTDLIRLETVLATRYNIPVKKEFINRYSLDYYLRTIDAECIDYAYINIGERITASFILNKSLVKNSEDSVFDLSEAVLSGNYAGNERRPGRSVAFAQEIALKKLTAEKIGKQLSQVIRSALLFFPVNDIFINGQWKNLDQIVEIVAKEFPVHPVIRKSGTPDGHVNDSFALRILTENYRRLVEA